MKKEIERGKSEMSWVGDVIFRKLKRRKKKTKEKYQKKQSQRGREYEHYIFFPKW